MNRSDGGATMSRAEESGRRQLPMRPGWGEPQPQDPNWHDGTYHGMRMELDSRRAAYGFHRLFRAQDLGGHGGFDGRYDAGRGSFGRNGLYRDPFDRQPALRAAPGHLPPPDEAHTAPRHVEDGGVRGDNAYLRQYNSASPALKDEDGRAFGHAPAGSDTVDGGAAPDEPPRPEAQGGQNPGGFAEQNGSPGPEPGR
jgi:hypothetical protein